MTRHSGHRIRITDDGHGSGVVMLDETDISTAVGGYTIKGAAREKTEVTLDLARIIDVSTLSDPGQIIIDSGTVDLLIRLGFTPPEEYDGTLTTFTDPTAGDTSDLDLRGFGDDIQAQRDYQDDRMAAQAIVDRVKAEAETAGRRSAFHATLNIAQPSDMTAERIRQWVTEQLDDLEG